MELRLFRQHTVAYCGARGVAVVLLERVGGPPDNDENPPRYYMGTHETRDLATAAAMDEARGYDRMVRLVS